MEVVAPNPEPVMSLEEVKQGIIKEMPFMATWDGSDWSDGSSPKSMLVRFCSAHRKRQIHR